MRHRRIGSVLTALLAAGVLVPAGARATVASVATGTGGAVTSMDVNASRAGIDALRRGGNAVDAAVATASALGVTIPFVAGPGGGGFMVIYNARTHRVTTIDGREACPAACTPTMFTDPMTGKPMDYTTASNQPLSTGVPSMVATWDRALKLYGNRTLGQDLQPAIGVARRGFRVNFNFNQLEQAGLPTLQAYTASRKLLLTPAGQPLPVGTLLRNPDLARTYALIARDGAKAIYNGPIGRALVSADDHPGLAPGTTIITNPGIMSMKDLRSYRTRVLAPTQVSYRGLKIYGMAPPSSGGSTEGEILNLLSGFRLGSEPRATALFHYLEASRLAYADRNRYLGDPRYVHVPLGGLLDPRFAALRRCQITSTALTSPVAPGTPFAPYPGCSTGTTQAQAASPEAHHTNNIVTVDG
ncbi:MAG: gamma-glutamyltransferase, partial [Actinomycetota bacterium]|nr:gamma-glutamyltransferase [Actinomycetota bacterium]